MSNGMNEPVWEGTMCIVCDYWLYILGVIAVALSAYFGQSYFL